MSKTRTLQKRGFRMEQEILRLINSRWPELEYVEDVGSGSYGTVYHMVRHDLAGTFDSAVKVIVIPDGDAEVRQLNREGYTQEQTFSYFENVAANFAAEISLMETLRGRPNVTAIEDYTIIHPDDKMLWYILIRMELLNRVDYTGMKEADIIRLGIDVSNALIECRKLNVIHRDIKPDNILIDGTGQYKLGDFGIARKLERSGTLSMKFTPNYSAPEIAKAEMKHADIEAAARADIYSLGLVMYWIGNGCRLPHLPDKQILSREDRENAFYKRIQGEPFPPPAKVSPPLQKIIMKACSYHADDRYQSAAEMKNALQGLIKNDPPLPPEPKKRRPVWLWLCLAALCCVAVWKMINPDPEPTPIPGPEITTPALITGVPVILAPDPGEMIDSPASLPGPDTAAPASVTDVSDSPAPASDEMFDSPTPVPGPETAAPASVTDVSDSPAPASGEFILDRETELTAETKCKIRPSVWWSPKYKDTSSKIINNVQIKKDDLKVFKASTIQEYLQSGTRDYGIFLRFTPGGIDDGFEIHQFHLVISDPENNKIAALRSDLEVTCQKNVEIKWDFVNLMEIFRDLMTQKGEIPTGIYTMDIYFNQQWTNNIKFKIIQ